MLAGNRSIAAERARARRLYSRGAHLHWAQLPVFLAYTDSASDLGSDRRETQGLVRTTSRLWRSSPSASPSCIADRSANSAARAMCCGRRVIPIRRRCWQQCRNSALTGFRSRPLPRAAFLLQRKRPARAAVFRRVVRIRSRGSARPLRHRCGVCPRRITWPAIWTRRWVKAQQTCN